MANSEKIKKELMFEYTEQQVKDLLAYIDLVLEKNAFINLTAIKDPGEAIEKHLFDSLQITKLEEYKTANRIIDIGTGAGFPGALLAIASPDKEFVLVDSTLKRLKVIDEFADILGIKNITTVHARAEELARDPEYAEAFDLCVSRAVANLTTLSSWCLPFVKKGGCFVAYKGENYQEELDAATETIKKLHAEVKRITNYPQDYKEISNHVLLTFEKK